MPMSRRITYTEVIVPISVIIAVNAVLQAGVTSERIRLVADSVRTQLKLSQ